MIHLVDLNGNHDEVDDMDKDTWMNAVEFIIDEKIEDFTKKNKREPTTQEMELMYDKINDEEVTDYISGSYDWIYEQMRDR